MGTRLTPRPCILVSRGPNLCAMISGRSDSSREALGQARLPIYLKFTSKISNFEPYYHIPAVAPPEF